MFSISIDPNLVANSKDAAVSAAQTSLLESLEQEIKAHFEAFPETYQSSHIELSIAGLDVDADAVSAALKVKGTVNGLPSKFRCKKTVNIKVARKQQAMRATGSPRKTSTSDAVARLALGRSGVVLLDALRVSKETADQRRRYEQGQATAEDTNVGFESAAAELFESLCDAVLIHFDKVVCRRKTGSEYAWKAVLLARWVFTGINFIAMALVEYYSDENSGVFGSCVFAALFMPVAFYGVHFAGLAVMPKDFFSRDASGRAAMNFSGLKTVLGVRILSVFGATLFLGALFGIWCIGVSGMILSK